MFNAVSSFYVDILNWKFVFPSNTAIEHQNWIFGFTNAFSNKTYIPRCLSYLFHSFMSTCHQYWSSYFHISCFYFLLFLFSLFHRERCFVLFYSILFCSIFSSILSLIYAFHMKFSGENAFHIGYCRYIKFFIVQLVVFMWIHRCTYVLSIHHIYYYQYQDHTNWMSLCVSVYYYYICDWWGMRWDGKKWIFHLKERIAEKFNVLDNVAYNIDDSTNRPS